MDEVLAKTEKLNVLVFSTTVETIEQINDLTADLNSCVGKGQWNFALDDRDKILRIISNTLAPIQAIELLKGNGFDCKELEG